MKQKLLKIGISCLGIALTLMLITPQLPARAATTVQNPFLWADVPDVDVIRVGNNYYMSSTTMHMNPGVPIMKSTDLVNWTIVNYVYPTLGSGDKENLANGQNEYGKGSWASSLRYKNGIYYLAFMSYTSNNTYIFQTTDIENGTWTKYALGAAYHDCSLLFNDDGRVYLTYGSGDIRIIELNADAKSVKAGGVNQIIIPNAGSIAGSGGLAAEGSHIQKINGSYYVFLISWPSGSVRTQLVYKASSVTGPYTGQVMLRNPGTGVAQGGVIDTPSGQWYAMLFQDHGAVGRAPFLISMTWNNGWPVMGSVTDTGISATPINASGIVVSDEFTSSTLGKAWQWNHNPNNSLWSLTARSGYMRLTTGSLTTSAGILQAKNTLTQRTFGPESAANVAVDVTNMKSGDYAGLAAFQFYYGFVGVKMSGTTKTIVMVRGSTNDPNSASTPVEVASVPLSQNTVYFKVYTDYRSNTDKAYFYYSLNGSTWTVIGSTLQMAYTLPHFMGYRFGLFNYSTTTTGGSVDFDYFRVASSNNSGPTPTPVPGLIEAETYNSQSGIATETCSEGGLDVANIENGDWIAFNNFNFSNNPTGFNARVASATSGGNIEIRLDSSTGTLVGTCAVTGTGGWQTYTTKTCSISGASGTHNLYLKFTGGTGFLFNVNWFQFTGSGGPTNTPSPTNTPGPTNTPTNTPIPGGNMLTNADMESGTTNWVVNGAGTLSSDTSQFHGGTHSVKTTGRTANWNGIGQNVAVSNFPTSGQNVTVSVWVRSQTGTPTGIATLRLTASTTTYVQLASAPINSTGWTLITGTVPVSWSGTLTGVLFYVETAAGTDNLYIDDANLHH
jgi:beta-xylosidase